MDLTMAAREEKKTTEELRQIWGAQQNPQLITSVQARSTFNKSFQNFSDFAVSNGLQPIILKQWSRAIFYNKTEFDIFAEAYLKKNPGLKRKPEESRTLEVSPSCFTELQAGCWQTEEFLDIWGVWEAPKARNIINGSSSIKNISGPQAASLIHILIFNYPRKSAFSHRFELIEYQSEAQKFKEKLADRYRKLLDIIASYHEDTDFCYLEPSTSVAVIAELMLSNPSKNST